jgi:uncharacterized membrane protein YhhN
MKTRIVSALYFLTGISFIILKFAGFFWPGFAAKAILMPLLIIIFILNIRPGRMTSHWILISALFFSWAGDVALELPNVPGLSQKNEILFMTGLVCFMIAHLFYIVVFSLAPGRNYAFRKFFRFILPVILYGAILLGYMYDDLGIMRLPVIMYTIVLLSMLSTAINRFKKVSNESYYTVLIGAALFVLSDSLLAVNKFSHPFQSSSALIMSTYITGQFMIVIGYIRQFKNAFA